MTWNYRIFRHTTPAEIGYGLHEAYYDKDGKMDMWTETHYAYGDTPEGIIEVLTMMLNDAKKCQADIPDFKPTPLAELEQHQIIQRLESAQKEAVKWKQECQNLMEVRKQLLEEKEELLARSLKKP